MGARRSCTRTNVAARVGGRLEARRPALQSAGDTAAGSRTGRPADSALAKTAGELGPVRHVVGEVTSETAAADALDDLWLGRARFDDGHHALTHVEAREFQHGAAALEFTLHGSESTGAPAVLARAQPHFRGAVAARWHGVDQPME